MIIAKLFCLMSNFKIEKDQWFITLQDYIVLQHYFNIFNVGSSLISINFEAIYVYIYSKKNILIPTMHVHICFRVKWMATWSRRQRKPK